MDFDSSERLIASSPLPITNGLKLPAASKVKVVGPRLPRSKFSSNFSPALTVIEFHRGVGVLNAEMVLVLYCACGKLVGPLIFPGLISHHVH